jgi:hypothetical protein
MLLWLQYSLVDLWNGLKPRFSRLSPCWRKCPVGKECLVSIFWDRCDEFSFTTCICLWSSVRASTYNMHRLVIAMKHLTFIKCKLAVGRYFFSIVTNQRLVDAEIAINGFMCCRECPDFTEGLTPMTAQAVLMMSKESIDPPGTNENPRFCCLCNQLCLLPDSTGLQGKVSVGHLNHPPNQNILLSG